MLMSIEEMAKLIDEKKKEQRQQSHHEDEWDNKEWWDYSEDDGKMTVEERNK